MHRQFQITALALTALIWVVFVGFRMEQLQGERSLLYVFGPVTAVLPSAVLAVGLALIITLLRWNWRRWRAVLRPNIGRIIGAVALFAVTSLVITDWLPWIPAGLFPMMMSPDMPRSAIVSIVGCTLGLIAAWYPVSALFVSGLKSKWLRFGAYCLMFWSGYSLQLLIHGVVHFTV